MKRREFVYSVIAVCLSAFGSRSGLSAAAESINEYMDNNNLKNILESYFSGTECPRSVGMDYLARHPEMAKGAIDRTRQWLSPAGRGQQDTPALCLARQQHEDFTNGRTVIIDGWVYARCEADLCATFASLVNGELPDAV